jgi:signal transduction histidine kinase
MNSLSIKLSLLFLGIALLTVGILAVWINQAVSINFASYCMRSSQACTCDNMTVAAGPGAGIGAQVGRDQQIGDAERVFLEDSQRSLLIAALVSILVALGFGFLISMLVTRPMRQLSLSARKIAEGDLAQRIKNKGDDEIGEVAVAFNSMAEQLEKKEKSRKQLLADVAHELRNPLSIVQGNLEAWLDGVITPTPGQIASVYDETVLLNRLITDLRELSLAEAGQLKLHLEQTDLKELIEAEVTAFNARSQEKGVALDLNVSGSLPGINVDRDRIKQVLHNLLENALRYTPSGGSVSVKAEMGKDKEVIISVTDTGSGIEAVDLPNVFDHFYKADKSRHRAYGNTGIGLALVKNYVELHGGKVWVESEPGKGSAFYFTLPVSK